MTVVVDELIYKRPNGRKNFCHMFASSLEELHAFAELIGRKRCWFHRPKSGYPHYDLDAEFRQKALDNDAQETLTRVYVESVRKYHPIATAPKDGTWINIVRLCDGALYKCRWNPRGSSIIKGKMVYNTGCWEADIGGWFEPHEVLHWTDYDPEERRRVSRQ